MATRYKLDEMYHKPEYVIDTEHFNLIPHEHTVVTTIKVYQCKFLYDEDRTKEFYNRFHMERVAEISEYITDYDASYTDGDNICQSASITIKVPKDNYPEWYSQRELYTEYHQNLTTGDYGVNWDLHYYELVKEYYFPRTGETQKMRLGYYKVTDTSYSLSATESSVKLTLSGLSCTFQGSYGGNSNRDQVSTIVQITKRHKNPDNTVSITKENVTIKSLLAPTIESGTMLSNDLVYQHAIGSWSKQSSVVDLGYLTPTIAAWCDFNGSKAQTFYEKKDFDANCSRADVLSYIVDNMYVGGRYWIDESLITTTRGKQNLRMPCIAKWRDYGDLFIDEHINYNDSDYYNITVVSATGEINGTKVSYVGRYEDTTATITQGYRVQHIKDDNLQSDEECNARAKLENYNSMWGHENYTITLADNYLDFLNMPSLQVGRTIEYRNTAGFTSAYTIKQISFQTDKIEMVLLPFKPLFPVSDNESVQKATLGTPLIVDDELVQINGNYYIRLYIQGDDIDYGFVRIYDGLIDYRGDSRNKDEQGRYYADIPVTQNGLYSFYAQLESPYFERSGWSGNDYAERVPYDVVVNEIIVPAQTEDPDPYPHPNAFEPTDAHEPYITTGLNTIVDDDGYITV